jgi:hypothetical protein
MDIGIVSFLTDIYTLLISKEPLKRRYLAMDVRAVPVPQKPCCRRAPLHMAEPAPNRSSGISPANIQIRINKY